MSNHGVSRSTASLLGVLRDQLGQPDLRLAPGIVLHSGRRLAPLQRRCWLRPEARRGGWSAQYPSGIAEEVVVEWGNGSHTEWVRRVRNDSTKTLKLVELSLVFAGIDFGYDADDNYFYHAENSRIYGRMALPVRCRRTPDMALKSELDVVAGTRWADPGVVSERIGASVYQPFPAILLSNYRTRRGLVHGSLSQRVFFHNHLVKNLHSGLQWTALSSLKTVRWRDWQPGETLEDRWYLGVTDQADLFSHLFDGYTRALRPHLPPMRGASVANRHSVVWGSWNDGIHADIDETRLLKMADFLRNNLPTVHWLQIDDGYAAANARLKTAHGLGVPFEGRAGIDPAKFPHGLKATADGIRARGLRPALWIGGSVPSKAQLAVRRPDWFIDYTYRLDFFKVLDVSKPEVRDYMTRALDVLLSHGGFEGMKHDFWSYAFEDSHPLLANTSRSGTEWRSWWLLEILRRLPSDGYLQTGCDIVMANPFLGEHFTNYRYGIDVGGGKWEHVLTTMLWGAACFATRTGDLFVPNSDSIGILPRLADNEAQTAITYCLISRSLVEVSGWLYQTPRHPRLAWVKKALCCPNNGQDVFFADYDYRTDGDHPPAIWFFHGPHFSRLRDVALPLRTVAIFNLTDQTKTYSITSGKLGLANGRYAVTDVWTGETQPISEFRSVTLPARSSRLLSVSATNGWQVFDADAQITAVAHTPRGLSLTFAFAGTYSLTLSQPPTRITTADGRRVKAAVRKEPGSWHVRLRISKANTVVNLIG